ncbi:AI-2E family transporter [Trueperella sp. LYQ143]|uniref:AI-2E family transporter n=1 Tax=Trueperella sp. LYQ143 TaxID=3391059 RepID=UPI0039834DC9
MGLFARLRSTRHTSAKQPKTSHTSQQRPLTTAITDEQLDTIADKKQAGVWDGMVAPPTSRPGALGIPHWLAKYGLASWAIIGIAIVAFGICLVLSTITEVFLGVFLACVLTSVLLPIVNFLDRFMPRALATALAIIGGFAVFGGLVSYVVFSVANEWDDLATEFQHGADDVFNFLSNGPLPWHISREQATQALSNAVAESTEWVQNNSGTIATTILTNASQLAVVATVLALAIFVTICLLAQGSKMWLWFLNCLPERNRERINLGAYAGWVAFSGYARGTVIISLLNGTMCFIFLLLVGVPLVAPLAVLVVMGSFIPLVGAPIAMFIAMIVALASGGAIKMAIVGLGIAGIGQIEGHIFQPLIMGNQVSLHPVVVAIGVAAGGFAGGLVGAVIAIPIMAIAWSAFRTLHQPDPKLSAIPYVPKSRVLPAQKSRN